MKEKKLFRILKVLYLICCLSVAFTPNIMKDVEYVESRTTQVDAAEIYEVAEYENAFKHLEKNELIKHEGITSVIIAKDGKVYYEKYFNGSNEDSIFEIHSCTKTIIAILTGIAHDQGMIGDEQSKYIDMFQGLVVPEISDGMEEITVENMLTMSSGINWDKYSSSLMIKIAIVKNGVDYGLSVIPSATVLYEPGTHFYYNSNESRSLMAMVAYNSGMEDLEFADKYLFNKLEIEDYLWPYDDSGLLPGGKDLFLSSRDMMKIGQLLLDEGIYKGEQIVSKEWVDKMLTPIVENVPAEDILPADSLNYGFYMWHMQYKGIDINYAYGRGGQCIFLVPEYNICVVTSAIDKERSDSFRNIVYDVVDIYQGEYSYE